MNTKSDCSLLPFIYLTSKFTGRTAKRGVPVQRNVRGRTLGHRPLIVDGFSRFALNVFGFDCQCLIVLRVKNTERRYSAKLDDRNNRFLHEYFRLRKTLTRAERYYETRPFSVNLLFLLDLYQTLRLHGSAAKAALITQLNLYAAMMLGMNLLLKPMIPCFSAP